jgi:hypothetical protein
LTLEALEALIVSITRAVAYELMPTTIH